VSFVASDGTLADTIVVQITVSNTNLKPALALIPPQSVNEGATLNVGVSATDPDGTIPSLTAINLPLNATFTDLATGSGSLAFAPNFTQAGIYNVSFIASDGLLADTQIVAVTVVNVNLKPTLAAIAPQTVNEGATLAFRVSATDPDATIPSLSALNLPANATFADSLNGAGSLAFAPTFTQAGVYNVSFIASDGALADTQIVAVTVVNVNLKPTQTAIAPQSVNEGATLNLGVSATDPDGTIPSLTAINLPLNATFTDLTTGSGTLAFSPNFTQAGVYNVSFIASDGALADTQIVAVTVNNVNLKPTLAAIAPQTVNEGATLNVGVSATDPDGTIPSLTAINLPLNATFTDLLTGSGTLAFSPNFTQAGVYNVSFIASDGLLADTQVVAITVNNVNQKPVLAVIPPQTITEGQILAFRVGATDGDGTIPTLSATGLPTNATFADSLNGAGAFRFAPNFTQSGVYSVKFFAGDGLLTDSITVSITVLNFGTNAEPIITPIADTVVNEGGSLILTITATDPDIGSVAPELSISTTLKNYTFSPHGDGTGTLQYLPGYINAGKDTVRVFATDFGSPRMTTSTKFVVTTNDVNQPPTWVPIGPFSLSADQTLSFVVVSRDTTDPVGTNRLFLSAMNPSLNSTFRDSANGHGLFTFAPTSAQVGVDTVEFLSLDQGAPAMSSILSVIITVKQANRPPVLAYIGPKVVTEGQLLQFTVSATDPEGVIPALSADNLPANATFVDNHNGTGLFRFTPNFLQGEKLYAVTFKAFDLFKTAKEVVFIQVHEAGNQKPVFDSLSGISVVEADSVTQVITAHDPEALPVTISAIDTTIPTFVIFTGGTGTATIKAKPAFSDAGVYVISLVASDGTIADTATILLTVIDAGNQPPILAAIGNKQVTELLNLKFRVSATDADGTKPILTIAPLPTGAVFIDSLNGAGSFNWSPTDQDSGTYLVTFFAQDADSLPVFDSELVTIVVKDTNRVPLIITSGSRTMNEGDSLFYVVYAIDPDGTIPKIRARLDGTADTLATNMVMFDSGNGSGLLTFRPSYTQGSTPGGDQTRAFYNVRFYAKDGTDTTLVKDATAPVQITVMNKPRPPVMAFSLGTGPFTITEGAALTFSVTASDPDGGSITALSVTPLLTSTSFSGALPTRTFTFMPNFLAAGTYDFTFTATKTGGLTSSQIVHIVVTEAGNQNPIFSTVLADTINCPVNILTRIVVRATDPDLNSITITGLPIVINGSYLDSLNGTGVYNYLPDNLDLGAINRITFIARDPSLAADTVTTVLRVTAFLRGDVDNNAKYTMNDLAYLIGYLYREGPVPASMVASDVDRDGGVNIGDVTYLINFLYLNGPRPPQ
jgi:hypothetical protein